MSLISEKVKNIRDFARGYGHAGIRLILDDAADTIEELSAKLAEQNMERSTAYYNGGWIPCSERLPSCEKEVFIVTERGKVTTAMYEDGEMLENDSCWFWEELNGEWDEENDCYIIPEGWWEQRHFLQDGDYNNPVDEKVLAWMPLPEPYKGK